MTTNSLKKILDREFSKAYLVEEIKKSSELLKEIINYSTNVITVRLKFAKTVTAVDVFV